MYKHAVHTIAYDDGFFFIKCNKSESTKQNEKNSISVKKEKERERKRKELPLM